jgi:hypothetical protein
MTAVVLVEVVVQLLGMVVQVWGSCQQIFQFLVALYVVKKSHVIPSAGNWSSISIRSLQPIEWFGLVVMGSCQLRDGEMQENEIHNKMGSKKRETEREREIVMYKKKREKEREVTIYK